MPTGAPATPTVVPALRYADASAAIDWLGRAFGFEPHLVVPGDGDAILHAQLTLGNGMIMLGSARDDAFGQAQKTPAETDGIVTQSAYLIVDDADRLYHRARACGAAIVQDIADQSYGGRAFTCRDPEGHLWTLGTYDPWNEPA
ncbi:MAG: VOC family protein [Rubricoccaceae bacterium]|nr:VOC family protein [Rubricoccaceae bacterium]